MFIASFLHIWIVWCDHPGWGSPECDCQSGGNQDFFRCMEGGGFQIFIQKNNLSPFFYFFFVTLEPN